MFQEMMHSCTLALPMKLAVTGQQSNKQNYANYFMPGIFLYKYCFK